MRIGYPKVRVSRETRYVDFDPKLMYVEAKLWVRRKRIDFAQYVAKKIMPSNLTDEEQEMIQFTKLINNKTFKKLVPLVTKE